MNHPRYFTHPACLAILVAAGLFGRNAYADIGYTGTVSVDYAFNSLANANSATPGDLAGLSVTGSFRQLTDGNDAYGYATGDGTYGSATPDASAVPATSGFNDTYTASGSSAAYGTVYALQSGLFSLDFTNNGTSTFNVDVTMSYTLNAVANGLFAASSIELDYWDSMSLIAGGGQDFVSAATYPGFAYDNETETGSYELAFSLAPGTSESFAVQAAVNSSLDSTATPAAVPLPPAAWSFSAGLLGIFGIGKRRAVRGRPQSPA